MSLLSSPPRRSLTLFLVGALIFLTIFLTSYRHTATSARITPPKLSTKSALPKTNQAILNGRPIAPKLGNETIKAELGRAAWRLFHTTMARFPEEPSADESEALRSYIHLFQRLYPCGECSGHFGAILEKFPPQVSSRKAAAMWGCHVHNQVNKSLKKDMFDCAIIGQAYDCGCAEGDDDDEDDNNERDDKKQGHESAADVDEKRRSRVIAPDEEEPVRLAKEEYQKGG